MMTSAAEPLGNCATRIRIASSDLPIFPYSCTIPPVDKGIWNYRRRITLPRNPNGAGVFFARRHDENGEDQEDHPGCHSDLNS